MKKKRRVTYKRIRKTEDGKKYRLVEGFEYFSKRYGEVCTCEAGFLSDGATGARDLKDSRSWWVHDKLCERATWDDGSPVTNWEASMVLKDILDEEKRFIRKYTWKYVTFLLGGWKLKKRNGWI